MKTTCIQMDMLFAHPEENFAKAKRPGFSRKSVFPSWPNGAAHG